MMLKSRYVVPVDYPVIANGAVVVREGRIAAIGRARELTDQATIDFGDAVICPGFVNTHTHLELSLLAERVLPSVGFIDWLRSIIDLATKEPLTRVRAGEAMRRGISRSRSAGVTTVGDITRFPQWTREVLSGSVLRGVSFGEVIAIGKGRGLLADRLARAASMEHQTERMRTGISPHAPYTVEPEGFRACRMQADAIDAPLCMHLAETADEEAFTRAGTGRFADLLHEAGLGDEQIPISGCSPVELARRTGVLGPKTILAHANYVTDDDLALIAESGASVAYCPRTHRAFEHPPHRFREMLARGINVCVGTDSLASNPSLSILDELRFLRREYRDLPADQIMALGTLHGARALGFADVTGSITVGKQADLVVIPLEPSGSTSRWDQILESDHAPAAVYISGVRQRMANDE